MTRICLVRDTSKCLKQTDFFCDVITDLPVTRPVTFSKKKFDVYINKEWQSWKLDGFFYQLARDIQNANKTEMLIAKYYDISLLNLRAAVNFAKEIELEICGSNHSINDAADAVRHFSLSAYLAYYEGAEAANAFMMAHESLLKNDLKNIKSFRRKMRSLEMDYINNNLGISFSKGLNNYLSSYSVKEEIREAVYSNLYNDDFFILKNGQTHCDIF